MQMRDRFSIIILLLSVCFFAFAGRLSMDLRTQRPGTFEQAENAPPLLALTTVVLGGFRGLIADMLWLRATRLQDEGRYVELVQLADWITRLEPASPQIWGYHAWNMAFNVSMMMSSSSEKWRWIQNGIQLLRDEGLRYNPYDSRLCFELGWIYMFKIGGTTDDRHQYYKQRLAGDMQKILAGGILEPGDETSRLSKRLRQQAGMDLDLMRQIDQRFGSLDWRLPESHALYWAYYGMQSDGEHMLLERVTYQCLSTAFFAGKLEYDPEAEIYARSAAIKLLPGAMLAYESAMERSSADAIRSAYSGFLESAISELEHQKRPEQAQQLAIRLKQITADRE